MMRALQWTQPRYPAKPKPVSDVVRVNMVDLRKQKSRERADELRLMKERDAETIALRRKAANDSIDAANKALARLRQQWADECIVTFTSIGTILRRIAKATGVLPAEIMGTSRSIRACYARQAVMYWSSRRSGKSLVEIGRVLGRDHTSVLHGKRAYVAKRAAAGRKLRPL